MHVLELHAELPVRFTKLLSRSRRRDIQPGIERRALAFQQVRYTLRGLSEMLNVPSEASSALTRSNISWSS